jgi:type IV pilus assembly protein PilB
MRGEKVARKRLGDLLRDREHVSPIDLEHAIQEQSAQNGMLGEILLSSGKVKKHDLIAALEEVTRTKYVDCTTAHPEPVAIGMVPRAIAEKYCVLPLQMNDRNLQIAMAEPQNLLALDELRFLTGTQIQPRLGFRSEILSAIPAAYGESFSAEWSGENPAEEVQFISTSSSETAQAAMREFQAEMRGAHTPAVDLVSNIIRVAATKKASDIHIEQNVSDATVRIRVDGVLRELARIPGDLRLQLVSRIKILSDMDIAERRISQDGRFLANIGGRQVDLRVSTLPTQYGEKVVIRLLDASAATVAFENLGFSRKNSEQLYKLLAAPQGMILVTGPTGSGKSTTLYSALNFLKSPRVNITTIEDPVEYVIEGVNQVQVNAKAGRTFASCLRSMLRQDPNVVMVGEIRDGETAEIGLTAAQTGHLVLSTLHTNDSISAIARLLDLDVPSFLIASSVTAVVAQRLVRKLCSCRNEAPMSRDLAFRMRGAGFDRIADKMYIPVGCSACEKTGYKGRVGIYEVLVLNEQIRGVIRDGAKERDMRAFARLSGFEPMGADALSKLNAGVTTLEEIMRVVPLQKAQQPSCGDCSQVLCDNFRYCPGCGVNLPDNSVASALAISAGL